jgi:hypothetical protein
MLLTNIIYHFFLSQKYQELDEFLRTKTTPVSFSARLCRLFETDDDGFLGFCSRVALGGLCC